MVQNRFSSQYWPSWIHKCCQWIWRAICGVFSFLRLSKLCLKVGISLAFSHLEYLLIWSMSPIHLSYVVFDKSWTLTSLNQQWPTFLVFWSTLDKELSWFIQLKIIFAFLFSHFCFHDFWGDIPAILFKLASEGLLLESCRCQYYSVYAMLGYDFFCAYMIFVIYVPHPSHISIPT